MRVKKKKRERESSQWLKSEKKEGGEANTAKVKAERRRKQKRVKERELGGKNYLNEK